MAQIDIDDLENLAVGAAVLGTGGGGDPHVGKLMAQRAIEEHGPVELLSVEDLDDEALVIPTSTMGAPTVGVEKLPEGNEPIRALERLERELDEDATATMLAECGGGNSTIPFTVGARQGIPVVDADGMGRAFPELHQETFNVYGADASPTVIADEMGDTVMFETEANESIEDYARAVTIEMGGRVGMADYPMYGPQVRDVAIPGTVTLAMDIGDAIRNAPERVTPVEQIKRVTGDSIYGRALELFQGKIRDVERRTEGGFAMGEVTIGGLDEYTDDDLEIEIQNENLIARRNGEVVATVPDLIVVLEQDTGEPITTERLRYGYRVTVLAIPAPAIMRTEAALDVWGPRYFDYDVDFVPLEQRFPEYYQRHGVPDGKEHLLD